MNFYELQPDIFGKFVPRLTSKLADEISFRNGTLISDTLPVPITFVSGHSLNDPPRGMHGQLLPLMSTEFIEALRQAGVSNLQTFPAEISSKIDGAVWSNYVAVNIVGLIACADLGLSKYTSIIERPGDGSLPLLAFERLKISRAKTRGSILFRLAESPGTVVASGSIIDHLRSLRTDEEWGITIDAC